MQLGTNNFMFALSGTTVPTNYRKGNLNAQYRYVHFSSYGLSANECTLDLYLN